jgi:hypothetical protein
MFKMQYKNQFFIRTKSVASACFGSEPSGSRDSLAQKKKAPELTSRGLQQV